MKSFFIVPLIFLMIGCTSTKGVYECQVIQVNFGEACSSLMGQRVHTCVITDDSYDPRNGVPNYCLTNCLQDSGYLSQFPDECILIRVGFTKEQSNESNPLDRTLTEFDGVYASSI